MDTDEIDNPATHVKCKCGATHFDLDNNPDLVCECDFFVSYQQNKYGEDYEDNQREADDMIND